MKGLMNWLVIGWLEVGNGIGCFGGSLFLAFGFGLCFGCLIWSVGSAVSFWETDDRVFCISLDWAPISSLFLSWVDRVEIAFWTGTCCFPRIPTFFFVSNPCFVSNPYFVFTSFQIPLSLLLFLSFSSFSFFFFQTFLSLQHFLLYRCYFLSFS